jgi:hypothetical protein
MNTLLDAKRLVLFLSIVLIIIVGLPSSGPAAAFGEFGDAVGARSLTSAGFPCETKQQDQSSSHQGNSSPASNTFCRLYTTTVSTARSFFSNGGEYQYLPWVPALVGLFLVSFLALAGWCAWITRNNRPRRKYHIGRTI